MDNLLEKIDNKNHLIPQNFLQHKNKYKNYSYFNNNSNLKYLIQIFKETLLHNKNMEEK